MDSISIIIPVYNEADTIASLIGYLMKYDRAKLVREIIVVDGGSSDGTCPVACAAGATVISSDRPGRAIQMNVGAKHAKGSILYFLHADSYPPRNFTDQILAARRQGHLAGGFRLCFDTNNWLLAVYAWFTRFPLRAFRYGDQSLYIDHNLFDCINGFREDHIVMEDNEIIRRITNRTHYQILPGAVITSARKYLDNGILRLQFIFACVYFMYHLGFPQTTIVLFYKRLVRNGKKPLVSETNGVYTQYPRVVR